MGETVESEKDALLERFFAFARHVCAALRNQGHWADYIDPCSGLPVRFAAVCAAATHMRSALRASSRSAQPGHCLVIMSPALLWAASALGLGLMKQC